MKRMHVENWSTRERLALASAVLRSGDQNWMSVSRAMRGMVGSGDGAAGGGVTRPGEWFAQKQCAVQYEMLLNTVLAGSAPPKRKKRSSLDPTSASSAAATGDTPQEIIVRKLTQERLEELRTQLVELRTAYLREKHEHEELISGRLDSRLDEIEQADSERDAESNRVKEQASPVRLEPQTPQPESKPTSPLLTSLLQMPSPAIMHRSPTISSLLNSPPPVQSSASTPPRPIAATTLSQLLESPTMSAPAIKKTQSPSRSPAASLPNNVAQNELSDKDIDEFLTELIPAGEQVLSLDNVKDNIINIKIDDIPLDTVESTVVSDVVDPNEVIVSADNIHAGEVVVREEDTSILSSQATDTSAIDTPDSDLIAETLNDLAELDSRTVEMIVVGPNAQLAGGLKEELVEITSTDIDLVTGASAPASAAAATSGTATSTMKEIIEEAEVVVEGEAVTEGVIEEAVVDNTVIVDNIVDFGHPIVEETVVDNEEEVVEEKVEKHVVVEGEESGEGEGKVVKEEVVVESEVVASEEVRDVEEDDVVAKEEEKEEEEEQEVIVERVSEEVVEEVAEEVPASDEAAGEEVLPISSIEESTVESADTVSESKEEDEQPAANAEKNKLEKESEETKEKEEDEDEDEDSDEQEEEEEDEDEEVGEEKEEVKKQEGIVEELEKKLDEKGEKKELVGGDQKEEKKEEQEEDEEEEVDVSAAVAMATNELLSSSSTPSTPTSAVLPNIASIASDTVSTSRPETPSTEEDNEPVANLAKKMARRPGGLSASGSLPNSPLSINAIEEKAALNAWKKSIMLVYNRLATHKYASLFLKPITNEQARGYHSVIHRPMDLSTIKKNIETGNLRTTVEFQRDLMLMFQNAIMYNNQNTLVYEMATQMQTECIQHLQLMVEAMGEGVPLRGDSDEMDSSKVTRGRGKTEPQSQPALEVSRKRKRSSMTENTSGKKRKVQGDE